MNGAATAIRAEERDYDSQHGVSCAARFEQGVPLRLESPHISRLKSKRANGKIIMLKGGARTTTASK